MGEVIRTALQINSSSAVCMGGRSDDDDEKWQDMLKKVLG